jgi:hypothetical protein
MIDALARYRDTSLSKREGAAAKSGIAMLYKQLYWHYLQTHQPKKAWGIALSAWRRSGELSFLLRAFKVALTSRLR